MHFFFYGTLLAGNPNPVALELHRLLRPVGPGTVVGMLHAVPDETGWFPALVTGSGEVFGQVYEARDGFAARDLARMDAYEDCDPADPVGSLYLRKETTVNTAGGECIAQVYRYNQPLPDGSRPIPRGDFAAWLAETGLPVFSATRSADG